MSNDAEEDRYSGAEVAAVLGITDEMMIAHLIAVLDAQYQRGKLAGIEAAQAAFARISANREGGIVSVVGSQDTRTPVAGYLDADGNAVVTHYKDYLT